MRGRLNESREEWAVEEDPTVLDKGRPRAFTTTSLAELDKSLMGNRREHPEFAGEGTFE